MTNKRAAKSKSTKGAPTSNPVAASPAATGPAGALFEAQVAAHYLLTMLAEGDARGMPGVKIGRVELQRAADGFPLDDVIVHGSTADGLTAVLEIQVKRTVTFAPTDRTFREVIQQIGRAMKDLDRSERQHLFAVATERSSAKSSGPYKDVMRWARELGSAATFFTRLARPKVANDDMRTFVATIRQHLSDGGTNSDDETVWNLLRRFAILHFDFSAPGSQSLELAFERSRNVLHDEEADRVGSLWKILSEKGLEIAAAGGERNRADLTQELISVDGFRLAGSHRNAHARRTLREAAKLGAAELRGCLGAVSLSRSVQLQKIRESVELGRYTEIRGVAGVGKSGLLGSLVTEMLGEGVALVLTPDRTPTGGWIGFKAGLGIELSPEAFLSDLASDGGATLFIDSLDSFSDPSRRATIIDLVRAAADVPALHVIATARSDFDRDSPSWLPADALERIGRAPVIVIDELLADELDELRSATPALRALLAEDHPARAVARNLFRLSRLLEAGAGAEQLHSEGDLLDRWWKTGDGPSGGNSRERRRFLKALADASLAGGDRAQADTPTGAIDELVATNSVRELHLGCIAFAHDTLRDWAVASRLHEEPALLANLPLDRPAPPSLARGVELAARLAMERPANAGQWKSLVTAVSGSAAHGSWRRWALLALVRSEHAMALLDRASPLLFADDGKLLKELIRTAIAVESQPMSQFLAGVDMQGFVIPDGMFAPVNGSWLTLARWLIAHKPEVPFEALPEIVDLFQGLGTATFFTGPLAAMMAEPLAAWLEELEEARDHPLRGADPPAARAKFGFHELLNLSNDVRHAFAMMAASVSPRAKAYLQRVAGRDHADDIIADIMKVRGTLAKAAPEDLADLTLRGLVPSGTKRREPYTHGRDEVFNFLDHEFLPSSPAHGPFFELLTACPEQGLRVVRGLADHAIKHLGGGKSPRGDRLKLQMGGSERSFPWTRSYAWSRGNQCLYALESALMALEAWGHQRIEGGDPVDQVLEDVLGPAGSPAAFLLVAVDLILSHADKTLEFAIPFLGSPELLSLDRSRQGHDVMPPMDLLGWGSLGPREPAGMVNLASLKDRPSRQVSLEQLLPLVLFRLPDKVRELRELIEIESRRIGDPKPGDAFDEPRLMARYALNQLDRKNWRRRDGGFEYVSPADEQQHVAALQAERAEHMTQFGLEAAIQVALEDPNRSAPDLPPRAVALAKQLELAGDQPDDAIHSRATTIVSAAMIAARDGDDALLASEEEWIRQALGDAVAKGDDDPVSSGRDGIRFNPVAIATVGVAHLWTRLKKDQDRDWLLALAGRPQADSAQGIAAAIAPIRSTDERLVRSLLRVALASQIQPERDWDDDADAINAERQERRKARTASAIKAECKWLDGKGQEPSWPTFPVRDPSLRNRPSRRFTGNPPSKRQKQGEDFIATQSAARWVRLLTKGNAQTDPEWLPTFVEAYEDWTLHANGAGLAADVEVSDRLDEWNAIFLELLARSLAKLDEQAAIERIRDSIEVPDESFFDIAADLVPALDRVYFNDRAIEVDVLVKARAIIGERLRKTDGWRWEKDRSEPSVETHIGPAIAVLFFNHYGGFSGAEAYLTAKGLASLDPFLVQLNELIDGGPVPFTSILTMNLLDVEPRAAHAGFFLDASLTWLQRQPDNVGLWIDLGMGARLARWLDQALALEPTLYPSGKNQIDDLLARLIRIGVPGANQLERKLAAVD